MTGRFGRGMGPEPIVVPAPFGAAVGVATGRGVCAASTPEFAEPLMLTAGRPRNATERSNVLTHSSADGRSEGPTLRVMRSDNSAGIPSRLLI
jgi:hypothetical protein